MQTQCASAQLTHARSRRRKRYDLLEARQIEDRDADDTIVLLPPINFIFKLLQSRATVSVWLYENLGLRIEGKLRVCSITALNMAHVMLM